MRIRVLVRGIPGTGKTHLAATFPKFYAIITTPGEEDTWMTRPLLKANCVQHVYVAPESEEDTKRVFDDLEKAIQEAKSLAKEGKVDTLLIDNFTHLMENRWLYINKYEKQIASNGSVDTRGMYGQLGRWAHSFVTFKLITFPGNLVVTVHEQVEEDSKLEKLPDRSSPVVPGVLGGFRDHISSFFSLDVSLEKREQQGKYVYLARTNKGNQRAAKSRYNLPPIIENISYDTIMKALNGPVGSVAGS